MEGLFILYILVERQAQLKPDRLNKPEPVISASRRWGSLEHGELAFKQAMHVDENNARASVLRSHIGGTTVTGVGTSSLEMNVFDKACVCG